MPLKHRNKRDENLERLSKGRSTHDIIFYKTHTNSYKHVVSVSLVLVSQQHPGKLIKTNSPIYIRTH